MRTKQTGKFTLIELLVVISILAILMSMLIPALNSAREVAKGIKCVSQLRQTVMAGLSYAVDYNNMIPSKVTYGAGWRPWNVAFCDDKYLTREVLLCPSIQATKNITWYFYKTYGTYIGTDQALFTGSAIKRFGSCAEMIVNGNAKHISLNKAKNTSDFVIFADTAIAWDGPQPGYGSWQFAMASQTGDKTGVYLGHSQGNGAAVAFVDGHAGVKSPKELVGPSMLHVYTSKALKYIHY